MLRTPSSSKYKHSFLRYTNQKKGTKGYSHSGDTKLLIITKNSYLFHPKHVEIVRRYLNKKVKDCDGSLDIRIFPSYPCSKKPLQSRMGKGKGRPSHFVVPIYKGMPLALVHKFLEYNELQSFIRRLEKRLPIKIKNKIVNQQTIRTIMPSDIEIISK